MVENKNDWFNSLVSFSFGSVVGFTSLIFIIKLLDENRRQLEDDIEKATKEFAESLKDTRDKVYNDATEECANGIRKDLEDDVEKYLTSTREKLEDKVKVVRDSVRKVLEAEIENKKRGTPADKEALIYAIDECLTDINKLLKYDI